MIKSVTLHNTLPKNYHRNITLIQLTSPSLPSSPSLPLSSRFTLISNKLNKHHYSTLNNQNNNQINSPKSIDVACLERILKTYNTPSSISVNKLIKTISNSKITEIIDSVSPNKEKQVIHNELKSINKEKNKKIPRYLEILENIVLVIIGIPSLGIIIFVLLHLLCVAFILLFCVMHMCFEHSMEFATWLIGIFAK